MAHFHRKFVCSRCSEEAELEQLTGSAVVIECKPCEISELWDTEDIEPELLLFTYRDEKMAEA